MSVQHTYSAHNGNIMGQYKKFDFHLFVGEILWDKIKTKWDEMYGLHRAPTWHYICTKMPSRTKKNVNYAPIFRTLCSHIPPIMLLCCILFYILHIVMYFAHYAPIFRPLCFKLTSHSLAEQGSVPEFVPHQRVATNHPLPWLID